MGEITGCEIIKCTDWIDGKCHYDGPCKYHWATFEIAEDEAKDKNIESLRVQLKEKDTRIVELEDFAIWMTGCGYDFCQHPYFVKMRDKLLKGE